MNIRFEAWREGYHSICSLMTTDTRDVGRDENHPSTFNSFREQWIEPFSNLDSPPLGDSWTSFGYGEQAC